jgi:ABC-type sugar transport system substrate-binding protein
MNAALRHRRQVGRRAPGPAVCIALGVALLASCASDAPTSRSGTGASSHVRLGLSLDLSNEIRRAEREAIEAAATRRGATVTVVVANNDPQEQREQISRLITGRRVDALLVVAQDREQVVASILEANAAGLPFVAVDRAPAPGGHVTFQITGDPQADGRLAGRFLAQLGRPLRVLHLVGALSDDNAVGRRDGFTDAVAGTSARVVAEALTDWDPDTAGRATAGALTRDPALSAIFVPSDFLLPAVSRAIQRTGRARPVGDPRHIVVVTVDGDPVGCRALRNGLIDADVATDVERLGGEAVDAALTAVRGEPVRPTTERVPGLLLHRGNLASDGHRVWGCSNP